MALATILGLGLIGIEKGSELKIEGTEGVAAYLSVEERAKKGIIGRLPRTLREARDAAWRDTTINDVLGHDFVEKYLDVNEVRNLKPGQENARLLS